ncbi:MAG TPA: phosphoglucomutase/phosphomannomutase family protein, partial [Silvibacterium sp.]|nr:phosphoglucomutase/phosphomannomutase family protein [Silvibacterium sp.]
MVNRSPVKFGTDGWRGIIADDFTFANVRVAAAAIASYLHASSDPKEAVAKGVCIGYDTRFASPLFARAVAEIVASSGIPVKLASR